jgi:hypothetical protein
VARRFDTMVAKIRQLSLHLHVCVCVVFLVFHRLPSICQCDGATFVNNNNNNNNKAAQDQDSEHEHQHDDFDLGFELDLETDFPDLLGPDDVEYFFENNDMDGLHWALSNVFARSKQRTSTLSSGGRHLASMIPPNNNVLFQKKLPEQLVSRGGGSTYTTAYKIEMDVEQAQYLLEHADPPLSAKQHEFIEQQVLPTLDQMLKRIPPLDQLNLTKGLYAFTKDDYEELGIHRIYNKNYHARKFDLLRNDETGGVVVPLINTTSLNHKRIEEQWFGKQGNGDDAGTTKGIVVLDDVLSTQAFDRIRQLLLEQTVWYQTKLPLEVGGYVGAYLDDGLHDKLLLQLAWELHAALPPSIIKGHPLRYLWAYKYDSDIQQGIRTHADEAAVNVNLWLTPNDSNLNYNLQQADGKVLLADDNKNDGGHRDDGGLVVFTAKPPADWNFKEYNTDVDKNEAVQTLLKSNNFENVTVPFRANRAVIFDSALFHHTDTFSFKPGYANRRINLTLLYGHMQQAAATATTKESGNSTPNHQAQAANSREDEL